MHMNMEDRCGARWARRTQGRGSDAWCARLYANPRRAQGCLDAHTRCMTARVSIGACSCHGSRRGHVRRGPHVSASWSRVGNECASRRVSVCGNRALANMSVLQRPVAGRVYAAQCVVPRLRSSVRACPCTHARNAKNREPYERCLDRSLFTSCVGPRGCQRPAPHQSAHAPPPEPHALRTLN